MRIESDGHSRGNPRLYELIEHAPKTGKSPTVWAQWIMLTRYENMTLSSIRSVRHANRI